MTKLTKKLLEKMIREEMGKGPLGNYVFPHELKDKYKSKWPEAEDEENTKVENVLRMLIDRHVNQNLPLPNKYIKLMLQMIKDKNYPDVFRPIKSGKLYRGMRIRPELFKEKFGEFPAKPKWYQAPMDWMKGIARKQLDKPTQMGSKGRNHDWYEDQVGDWEQHAESIATSWTKSLKSATHFANIGSMTDVYMPEGHVGVILIADAAKHPNQFVDLAGIYEYFKLADHYSWEQEVISLGEVDLDSIAWKYYDEWRD